MMLDLRELPPSKRARRAPLAGAASTIATAVVSAGGAWLLYSHLAINHAMPLPKAIDAERHTFVDGSGRVLSYYVDGSGDGRPLVLLHSINAAASAFEMKPLFEHYRGSRPVYALDLPGYGFSDRSPRRFTPQVFEEAILDLLTTEVKEHADVVALSLSSEFAAWAALAQPSRIRSLALISPTGLKEASSGGGTDPTHEMMLSLLAMPLWARPLFDLLTTRASIKWFLSRSHVGPVPTEHVDYAYVSAHQPHAEHAPLAFLSGGLFTPDVREYVYQALRVPTLVLYDKDPYTSFEALPWVLERNTQWQAFRITPSKGLPHVEQLYHTAEALDRFWQALPS